MKIGTLLYTWLFGKLVGTDEWGNRYYRSKGGQRYGRERRWVLYDGKAEASKVPSEWHAWLHHTTEAPLTENAAQANPWQKPHMPNLTGTDAAYKPGGQDRRPGEPARDTGGYERWTPE